MSSVELYFGLASWTPSANLRRVLAGLQRMLVWAVVVCVGGLAGITSVRFGLPGLTTMAVMIALGLAVTPLVGFRAAPVVGLIFSIPLPFAKTLVYPSRSLGLINGISVGLVDVCLVWLLAQYIYLHKMNQIRRVSGLAAFCLPLAFILLADVLSFRNSADRQLSLFGLVSDVRNALVFLALAVTMAQGTSGLRDGLTGVAWAVICIGSICIVEAFIGINYQPDPDWADGYAFRAGGLSVATSTAGYLAILLPLLLVELIRADGLSRRCLAGLALSIGLAGLACTLTRAAMGFMVIGSFPLVVFLLRERILRVSHIVGALVAVASLLIVLGDRFASRLDEGTDNASARWGLVGTAVNMAQDSPVTGQGVNNYMLKMDQFAPRHQIHRFESVVHNKFLHTIAETGTLGLVGLVWFLGVALTRSVSLARRRSALGVGLCCALIVAALDMNFEAYVGGFDLLNVWMVAAFIAALSSATENVGPGPAPASALC